MIEKILNIIWLGIPVGMIVYTIISIIGGQEMTSNWNMVIWLLCLIFIQIMVLYRDRVITNLNEQISKYEELINCYKEILEIRDKDLKDAYDTMKKCLAGENKEVWNLIVQKFTETGSETDYTIDSFVTKSSVVGKYMEYLNKDKGDTSLKIKETPEALEYWSTAANGEMKRVKVVLSFV